MIQRRQQKRVRTLVQHCFGLLVVLISYNNQIKVSKALLTHLPILGYFAKFLMKMNFEWIISRYFHSLFQNIFFMRFSLLGSNASFFFCKKYLVTQVNVINHFIF